VKNQNPIKTGIRFSAICIAVLILVKIALFCMAHESIHIDEDLCFYFFMFWLLFYFLGNMFIYARLYSNYVKYLSDNHRDKYAELISIVGVRSGGLIHNSFREFPFLFSADDLGDSNVLPMKVVVRKSLVFLLGVFFSIPVLVIVFLFF
jgi:hypothetical protein